MSNFGMPTAPCNAASFNNLNTLTGTTLSGMSIRNGNIGRSNVISGNLGNLLTDNFGNINLAGMTSPCRPCNGNNNMANGLQLIKGIVNSNLGGVAKIPLTNSLANGLMGNVPVKFNAPMSANTRNVGLARFAMGNNGPYGFVNGFSGNQQGLQIRANDLLIDGHLVVTGQLPVAGAVAVNGQVATDGTVAVNYGCGNNVKLMY